MTETINTAVIYAYPFCHVPNTKKQTNKKKFLNSINNTIFKFNLQKFAHHIQVTLKRWRFPRNIFPQERGGWFTCARSKWLRNVSIWSEHNLTLKKENWRFVFYLFWQSNRSSTEIRSSSLPAFFFLRLGD